MFTVPLGLIGVVFMLDFTGTSLNVQSEMGAIFPVGIEVNTGVLMVEFANTQRKLGMTAKDATVKSAIIRFRPIIMTFLACLTDPIPMAIGVERGSEVNVPLARAVTRDARSDCAGRNLYSFVRLENRSFAATRRERKRIVPRQAIHHVPRRSLSCHSPLPSNTIE